MNKFLLVTLLISSSVFAMHGTVPPGSICINAAICVSGTFAGFKGLDCTCPTGPTTQSTWFEFE